MDHAKAIIQRMSYPCPIAHRTYAGTLVTLLDVRQVQVHISDSTVLFLHVYASKLGLDGVLFHFVGLPGESVDIVESEAPWSYEGIASLHEPFMKFLKLYGRDEPVWETDILTGIILSTALRHRFLVGTETYHGTRLKYLL